MSDTEETSKLIDESDDTSQRKHDPELGPDPIGSNSTKKSRAKSSVSQKHKNKNLFDRILFLSSSRWLIIFVIAVFALLYLFTNIQVSFVDQHRWMPSPHRVSSQNDIPSSLTEKYDREFSNRVLAPFRNLLNQLKGKIDDASGNLSAILPVRVQLNDSQTMALVEEESNMAALYYDKWKQSGFGADAVKHSSVTYCDRVKMISPHLVKQNNLFWQVVQTADMTVYLYNAYYDNRQWGKPAVKLISVTDRQVPVEKKKWWCLLWFDNLRQPVLSTVEEVYTVWPEYWDFGVKDGVFGPQIITCTIPPEYASQIPKAVSLQEVGDCNAIDAYPGNVLRVVHNLPKKQFQKPSIGICVQAFRFGTYDVSVRLVEWLEMVQLMGADKVYFYVYGATQNMMRVLRHYHKSGLVDFRKLTLPGEQVNVPSLYNYFYSQLGGKFWPQELIELNDCLYRNIHSHDYVAIFDIDEMIMPQTTNNWHELIKKIESELSEFDLKKKSYYLNRHAYVYEMFEETKTDTNKDIPSWLYMMRHTYRAELLGSGSNIKCFHKTKSVTAVHNHFPMRCINSTGHHSCDGLVIDPKDSFLMHYRRNRSPPEDCKTPKTPINCTIHDRNAWRFFDSLEARVRPQLMAIFGDGNEAK